MPCQGRAGLTQLAAEGNVTVRLDERDVATLVGDAQCENLRAMWPDLANRQVDDRQHLATSELGQVVRRQPSNGLAYP